MLIYVRGSDSFLAKKAIGQLKAKYREKNPSGAELLEIDAEAELPNWADLQAVPLFATSRLVVIKRAGLLTNAEQEQLANFSGNLPPTTVSVVWDSKKPAAPLASVLEKAAKVISAEPLSETALRRFVKARAAALGLEPTLEQINHILEGASGDLWFVESELTYLATAGSMEQRAATKQKVEEPFIYFNLARRRAWSQAARQLLLDYQAGTPFELLLGSLAAAIRKEVTDPAHKRVLVDLLSDIDFGVKTGLLDPGEGVALLSFHLPNPGQNRVQWEEAYYANN